MSKNQKKVTSKQVAERAGVSQTTVSFVLNQVENSNISTETRQRVLQAVQELNYVPDTAARALARGRSSNIGLLLLHPHEQVFIDEYIPNILTGLSQVARQNGFRILVEMITDDHLPDAYINLIRGKEVAGIIINAPTVQDGLSLHRYAAEGFPIVTLDNVHSDIYSVIVDKLHGVRKAVKHLINLGHQSIGCISYAPVPINKHAADRLHIFRAALESAHLSYDERFVREGNFDPETGYEAMKSILAEPVHPTAIFAMNDMMAFGAITAIREHGLRVPEDIAIVGFDDVRLARYTTPALTTIHEPDVEHGRRAAETLLDLINGRVPSEKHTRLTTELVIRQSCGSHLRASHTHSDLKTGKL